MRNIRKTISYQFFGCLSCFIIPWILLKYLYHLESLNEATSNNIEVFSYGLYYFIIAILITVITVFLFSFFDPTYKKDRNCDVMADIGFVLYFIVFNLFFNMTNQLDNLKLIENFNKDVQQIKFIVREINKYEPKTHCLENPEKTIDYICKYLKKPQTRKGNIVTINNTTYTFRFNNTCQTPHDIRTKEYQTCYIDIKNKNTKNNKYVRIYFTYNNSYNNKREVIRKALYQYSNELRQNNKTLKHIW